MTHDSLGWLRSLLWLLLLAFAVRALSGCAARSPQSARGPEVNIIVRPECLTKPVTLVDCNSDNPPKCRTAKVPFKASCAEFQVQQ